MSDPVRAAGEGSGRALHDRLHRRRQEAQEEHPQLRRRLRQLPDPKGRQERLWVGEKGKPA